MNGKRVLQILGRLPVLIVLGTVVLGLIVLANIPGNSATGAQPPPPQSTPPLPPTPTPRPTMTYEEALQARDRERQELEARGAIVAASGPETAGTRVTIAGKVIQLPQDAYVESFVVNITVRAGQPSPETPLLVIRRGSSTIWVSVPSGVVFEENVAPGESDVFNFLEAVLIR